MQIVSPGRAGRPDAASSVAPIATAIAAPCVLASERPAHPDDEWHPSTPSYVFVFSLRASFAGDTLYPTPQTVTIGDASPSLRRSWRTCTSTVRVSPANV